MSTEQGNPKVSLFVLFNVWLWYHFVVTYIKMNIIKSFLTSLFFFLIRKLLSEHFGKCTTFWIYFIIAERENLLSTLNLTMLKGNFQIFLFLRSKGRIQIFFWEIVPVLREIAAAVIRERAAIWLPPMYCLLKCWFYLLTCSDCY